jgi:hypothetical protein
MFTILENFEKYNQEFPFSHNTEAFNWMNLSEEEKQEYKIIIKFAPNFSLFSIPEKDIEQGKYLVINQSITHVSFSFCENGKRHRKNGPALYVGKFNSSTLIRHSPVFFLFGKAVETYLEFNQQLNNWFSNPILSSEEVVADISEAESLAILKNYFGFISPNLFSQ